MSGAAVALSGLSSRLDGLIEQLVVSYNISEKDLEVVAALLVCYNAAGCDGGGDSDGSGCELTVSRMMEKTCFSKAVPAFTNTIM